MKKLTSKNWNIDKVKSKGFEWFNMQVEHFISLGKIDKSSDYMIRKVYTEITGEKVEKPDKIKKEIENE